MGISESSQYCLRTYLCGDEESLVSLFNKIYENFIGFVPRTTEYWKWCVLSRPNLEEKGIVVVTNGDKIVGYAAVDKLGNILEFCCDLVPERREVVEMLLCWCVEYTQRHGGNAVSLNAPAQDEVVRQVCRELGFGELPFEFSVGALFLRAADFPQLLREIANQKKKIIEAVNETILISLRKVPQWCDDHVTMQVREGRITFLKEAAERPSISIDGDVSTFSSAIFGSRGKLLGLILKGRLKIRPFWKIPMAVKIFSWLQIRSPWYLPRADLG